MVTKRTLVTLVRTYVSATEMIATITGYYQAIVYDMTKTSFILDGSSLILFPKI